MCFVSVAGYLVSPVRCSRLVAARGRLVASILFCWQPAAPARHARTQRARAAVKQAATGGTGAHLSVARRVKAQRRGSGGQQREKLEKNARGAAGRMLQQTYFSFVGDIVAVRSLPRPSPTFPMPSMLTTLAVDNIDLAANPAARQGGGSKWLANGWLLFRNLARFSLPRPSRNLRETTCDGSA
jgi:hypothetical protein